MAEHKLTLEVEYESEDGWEDANNRAMAIGKALLTMPGVVKVEGHVDPEITEGRWSVEAKL